MVNGGSMIGVRSSRVPNILKADAGWEEGSRRVQDALGCRPP